MSHENDLKELLKALEGLHRSDQKTRQRVLSERAKEKSPKRDDRPAPD